MVDNDAIFNKIAEALLIDYSSVYYVNAVTNKYKWYSINPEYHSLQIEQDGEDFFVNMARDAEQVVYEEDKHIFQQDISKEKLLSEMKKGAMQSIEYRLMINGKPVYHTLRMIRGMGDQDDYFILGVLNVDKEVRMRLETEKLEKERAVFNQIAESLAAHYDVIYYVDTETGGYTEFTAKTIYGNYEISETGSDFFAEARKNVDMLVHPKDKVRVQSILTKDYLICALENKRQFSIDYRMVIDGQPQYTRLTVMWSSDRIHFIIGVENIDDEIRREKEHIRALKSANELARRDELTGAKNKTAYQELEDRIQQSLDGGIDYLSFAIAVCDLNDLKSINDTRGHKAGDEYIKTACKMICDIFMHSPVFRIGGDEFVVLLAERDYTDRKELIQKLREQVLENKAKGEGPVIATGLAEYDPQKDTEVSEVFERADSEMYENKKLLKA